MRARRAAVLVVALALTAGALAAQQRPHPPAQDTTRQRRQQPRARESLDENEQAAPRVDNKPLDPEMRGFIPLPGTDWLLRLGGYAKTDVMYDGRPAGNRDLFVTSSIPTGNPVAGEGQSFNLHVRQTRLSLELRRPSTLGPLRVFFEGDLYGPNGTTAPNLRHAYVQAGNLLVGRTFSAFIDVDALPDGVDFEGPGSGTFVFSPQIRYTWPLGPRWAIAFAAEQPVSELGNLPGTATPAARIPDLVVRPRYEAPWGHFQLSAVLRDLVYNDGVAGTNSTLGWGVLAAALIDVGSRDAIALGATAGRGHARYVLDLGGLGLDAAVNAAGDLEAIPAYGPYASLQHRFAPSWRAVLTAGWLGVDAPSTMPGTTTDQTQYYAASGIWSPRPTVDAGFSALYGVNQTLDGSRGHAWRIQGGLLLHVGR